MIASVPVSSAPDRLLTSIPRGDNHTNTWKWRSTLMPWWEEVAVATRPFKPISSLRWFVSDRNHSGNATSTPPPPHTHPHPTTALHSKTVPIPQSFGDYRSHWLVELFSWCCAGQVELGRQFPWDSLQIRHFEVLLDFFSQSFCFVSFIKLTYKGQLTLCQKINAFIGSKIEIKWCPC